MHTAEDALDQEIAQKTEFPFSEKVKKTVLDAHRLVFALGGFDPSEAAGALQVRSASAFKPEETKTRKNAFVSKSASRQGFVIYNG